MSFILDALKKSENERARQNGPALLEVRVVPRRRGVPAWAVVIGVVLLANLAVLGYALLRNSAPAIAPAAPVQPPATGVAPAAGPVQIPQQAPPLPVPPAAAPPAVAPPATDPASNAGVVNPADYQPARPPEQAGQRIEPPPPPLQRQQQQQDPGMDAGLPSAADIAGSGLPELRLALHVYDPNPASRYVLLNSQRLRESESTVDGVRVERINPDAVVLSWRGQRFRLQPGE